MSPRPWEQDSSTKKKEMVSYKILGLGREMKSKRRRTAAEDAGLYRYIGEGTAERPWLKVTRIDYLVTRRMVMVELLGKKLAGFVGLREAVLINGVWFFLGAWVLSKR